METYLNLFEKTIRRQADLVGKDIAYEQAKRAGLGLSPDGHVISCTGNPQLVLLRLIRRISESGNMQALALCSPLIKEILKDIDVEVDEKAFELI